MKERYNKEDDCKLIFNDLGDCYHLWTPENFEIIFRTDSDFRVGMGIIAIASMCFPDVRIITFELMSNHLHIMAAGRECRLREYFLFITKCLMRMTEDDGRHLNWDRFKAGIRRLDSLYDARNVLIYNNRNGFLVNDRHTPFSYPWGANCCYFNPDARKRYEESASLSSIKDRRAISHSHVSDGLRGLKILDGCFSPFSFCQVETGERLFRSAAHYFYMLGRNIEYNKEIAKEIGESISYTDDELYGAISAKCKQDYCIANISQVPADAKLKVARMMRFDYNASMKQIQRLLRIDANVLQSIFGSDN